MSDFARKNKTVVQKNQYVLLLFQQIQLPHHKPCSISTIIELLLGLGLKVNVQYICMHINVDQIFYQGLIVSAVSETYVSTNLKLPEIAREVNSDWRLLAQELHISNQDIDGIEKQYKDDESRCLSMLHHWVSKAGILATGECQ